MRERRWVVLARFPDALAAEMCAALMRERAIEARVEHGDPLSTAMGSLARVIVLEEDVRRARFALEANELTDAEVWYLATGDLDPQAARAASTRDHGAATARRRRAAGIAGALAITLLIAWALISR
jgi:hypothetical protein